MPPSSPPPSAPLPFELKAWSELDTRIERDFRFKTFRQAFAFMTEVALLAERQDHHPDWRNSYNNVTVALSTHSEGGITEKDFALARGIDKVFERFALDSSARLK